MTLRELIQTTNIELNKVEAYIECTDKTGLGWTCYDDVYNKKNMLNTISEEDLNKEVLSISISPNYLLKRTGLMIQIKNY